MKNDSNNLELRLRPYFDDSNLSSASCDDGSFIHQHGAMEFQNKRSEKQEITIFYDGKVYVGEVTELPAKAIIMMASRGRIREKTRTSSLESSKLVCNKYPTGFSMKRSLQGFFQKRQQRIQRASPHSHGQPYVFGKKNINGVTKKL